jgi:hypothetical protein
MIKWKEGRKEREGVEEKLKREPGTLRSRAKYWGERVSEAGNLKNLVMKV